MYGWYDYDDVPFNEERLKELMFKIRTLSSCMADRNSLVEKLHKEIDDVCESMYKGMDNALKNYNI